MKCAQNRKYDLFQTEKAMGSRCLPEPLDILKFREGEERKNKNMLVHSSFS